MIDRREFLKLGGATAFAVLFGGCEKVPRKILPFVIPPEDYTLGEALWYASVCRACPAGCGILVRMSEGRAKKIEGNPLHPVNRGRLCARGQAALQALYHPERLGKPRKRDGERGSGRFAEISWEEALSLLMKGLAECRAASPESLLLLSEPMRGQANRIVSRFLKAFGSPHRVAWDPYGPDSLLAAHEAVYGIRDLAEYDLAGTRYLLSFSGDFLETWVSPVHYAGGYGRMRQERETIRGKFVHFGARVSMTAASADLFVPVAPGTEGVAALGIAHVLVRDRLTPAAAAAAHLMGEGLSAYTPEAVGKQTGARPSHFEGVAREFARNQPGIALAGTAAATSTNGTFNVSCAALLNVLAGNLGKPGGVSFPDRSRAFARFGAEKDRLAPVPESGYAKVERAVEGMREGRFRVALLAGATNPAFTLPPSLGFPEALGKVPFVVSFASFLDETHSLADLVLPVPTFLEEWGDDLAPAGHAGDGIGLLQPAVDPFRDTRSLPDVLLAAARELGGAVAAALPWDSLRECMEAEYGGPGPSFDRLLMDGGRFSGGAFPSRPAPKASRPFLPKRADAAYEGDPAKYPLLLHLYPSIAHYDGRGANLPWLQELPDPVTTAMWRGWVEIHPETAGRLGIGDGEGVVVESPAGAAETFAFHHPGIAPGVAAMPLGQGHTRYGKVAEGRGGNPFALLTGSRETVSGLPTLQSVRVAVRKAKVPGKLVRAAHPQGQWKMHNIL